MANIREDADHFERSCRKKVDIIRRLIRGQPCAEDRALCTDWLSFISRAAKDEAKERDCLLEQMVRQLRQLGRLSLPFTSESNYRSDLRMLLDEEGRQRLRRLSPPKVLAPQTSRASVGYSSENRPMSPFVWRNRVQHLNTLEEQYRREELWRNELLSTVQPKEGTDVGVQVRLSVSPPRARKKHESKESRERQQRERAAIQRQLDLQRREEVRQLREQQLRERKLKVKKRRDHELYLLNKKRDEQRRRNLFRQDFAPKSPAHRQRMVSKERDQKRKGHLEQKEIKAREESEQRQKEDLQKRTENQQTKKRATQDRNGDVLGPEVLGFREEHKHNVEEVAGEQRARQEKKLRKKEQKAKREFLREAAEVKKQILSSLIQQKDEERLRKEEKLREKSVAIKQQKKMNRTAEVMNQSNREDQKPENRMKNDVKSNRKTKEQTETTSMEEPPGGGNSQRSDTKMTLRRSREKFVTIFNQLQNEIDRKTDPYRDAQRHLKMHQKKYDRLTEEIREHCQEFQKENPWERAEAGSEQHRDPGLHSWKMAQGDRIKEQYVQELAGREGVLQTRYHAEQDSTTESFENEAVDRSLLESPQTPKNQSLLSSVRFKYLQQKSSSEQESGERLPRSEVDDLVTHHSIKRRASPPRKNSPTAAHETGKQSRSGSKDMGEPRRGSGGFFVSYSTQTGRKRFAPIDLDLDGASGRKKHVLHNHLFSQLLKGSRPNAFNPKSLTTQNRLLQRKLSIAKKIALNKHILKTMLLEARRFIDLLLIDKAEDQPSTKPPGPIFQNLIDPLVQGMEDVSFRVLQSITLLDKQLETHIENLCNRTSKTKQQPIVTYEQTLHQWKELGSEHLVSDLFKDFHDLDPKLKMILQRIDELYKRWKFHRLNLQ